MTVGTEEYTIYSLHATGVDGVDRLPVSLKILLENLLRNAESPFVEEGHIAAFEQWLEKGYSSQDIAYHPVRVVMQDFTGVPAVVDLAAMRDALARLGGNPGDISPQIPVDLVVDHSVTVDYYGTEDAFEKNVAAEYARNGERYGFLKWGQEAFDNFRVVPPGTGIVHQVNLEYLAKVVWIRVEGGEKTACPDTCVGTDSHTTMINGLSVLGWGVGGIEAEAAMLNQPVTMQIPEVVGYELRGELREGVTATDLVLTVVEHLRTHGVVGKFVEFYGAGLAHLSIADRATIANMAPEYGATCGFFPVDDETLAYLRFTGRTSHEVDLVRAYAQEQGLWNDPSHRPARFTEILSLDLSQVEPSIAGPKRPQDRIPLARAPHILAGKEGRDTTGKISVPLKDTGGSLSHGDVVIAAITSCTNTSNPAVLVAAGLLAKKAYEKGLSVSPRVKTSFAPGSQVVTEYLSRADLTPYLNRLGFTLAGYGCTTCIGNSGPLNRDISQAIADHGLNVAAVLSGNRNFEGRISPDVKDSYLTSPPLVVAYALAGSMHVNLQEDPLGRDAAGTPVYLRDIWPSEGEIQEYIRKNLSPKMFSQRYASVFAGDDRWNEMAVPRGNTYAWNKDSTYIQAPPFFDDITSPPRDEFVLKQGRILALLGDTVTTDHISPAGAIPADSPAGKWLQEQGVSPAEFNSYGSRRGNHEVMMRGTFANIRIRNEMLADVEGGYTIHIPSGRTLPIYDAAMAYGRENTPLVVIAGAEYGTGSSRDWAAKGTRLLGVGAVVAESFERIHRSNLIGMGVLPLQFQKNDGRKQLQLTGREEISLRLKYPEPAAGMTVYMDIAYENGQSRCCELTARIDTAGELHYFRHGGILHAVLRNMAGQ
ncbi:aconitate hydratase AcnA [Chitinivibrio alkaliphilus]|uniref:Aconitate hydratase n=1 Tax=Chitinivibrio alkaliphilus ACht1 TaxID=1313304 RepID=U7D6B1_9BACT|nr:aconitate hydratase AcnA [Chitinivibrio alkaliphilus]ERP31111.1 aconitate hydratase [Chitinivibrio alkaliphilus ACht1]